MINRTPSLALIDSTPYEKLFNSTASYDHLKAFCCLCYDSTIVAHLSLLLEPLFVCFYILSLASKVTSSCLATKQVVMSKDLIFSEDHFPFLKGAPSSVISDCFSQPINNGTYYDDLPSSSPRVATPKDSTPFISL